LETSPAGRSPVADRIREILVQSADRPAIEFRGRWHSWGQVGRYADEVFARLARAGVPADAPVGLVARNRIPHAGVILGCAAYGRSLSMIFPFQSPEALAADLAAQRYCAVVADREDWSAPVIAAARTAGAVGIALSLDATDPVSLAPGLETLGPGPFRAPPAAPGFEVLSSGTTGPPKRIAIPMRALPQFVGSFTLGAGDPDQTAPVVHTPPFGTIGFAGLIARAASGARLVLLEKFVLEDWLAAVRRHRPVIGSAAPPILRKILEADVPREDLASFTYVFGGSSALEPETQAEFERRYGVPVLMGYGATEFAGTAASWTPELRAQFEGRKAGSVGRAMPGVELRIVDADTRIERPRGEPGLVEARIPLLGPDWIRTTDLATLDADDFLFLHGRGDGAISRGGFKILPERVVAALRSHPDVLDAVVLGVPDPILGEVPVAAVEPQAGRRPSPQSLEAAVRARLPAHHAPKRILVVDALPRNLSLKVDLRAARKLFDAPET
jgi:acyl-CoA synthetase (AMP-forming)/AMP-acid ligase II